MLALTLRILFFIVVVLFGCSCAVIRMGSQIDSLEEVVVEEATTEEAEATEETAEETAE